jgi:hypothetical protein
MAREKKSGSIPHPTLDRPKNMPGNMPSPAVGKMFGGKGRLKPHVGGKMHSKGGDFGPDQHGLHGAGVKAPRMASKNSSKAPGKKKPR